MIYLNLICQEIVTSFHLFAARCERAATYCGGRARKDDVRALEYGSEAGFQDSG